MNQNKLSFENDVLCKIVSTYYLLFPVSFSSNISALFSDMDKNTYWPFWKGNSATWDGKISFKKCNSYIIST